MVAACERYMTISRYRLRLTQRDRIAISIGAILFAILAKAPLYFELQVSINKVTIVHLLFRLNCFTNNTVIRFAGNTECQLYRRYGKFGNYGRFH
jgi:hypothetical protein